MQGETSPTNPNPGPGRQTGAGRRSGWFSTVLRRLLGIPDTGRPRVWNVVLRSAVLAGVVLLLVFAPQAIESIALKLQLAKMHRQIVRLEQRLEQLAPLESLFKDTMFMRVLGESIAAESARVPAGPDSAAGR